jgi:hypothetical protein
MVAQTGSGNSLVFNGTNGYVLSSATADLNGTVTIEAWIQTNASGNQEVITFANNLGYNGCEFQVTSDGKINFNAYFNATWNTVTTSTLNINDNNWHHVACTVDNTSGSTWMSIYVDGAVAVSADKLTSNAISMGGSGTVLIGKHPSVPWYFNGKIDEVRVSNNIRYTSGSHAKPVSPFTADGNTLALYHCNEEPGAPTAIDAGSYNAHASLNGGVSFATSTAPLPVELTSFTASVDNRGVLLVWRTATEVNNHGFEVERKSADLWQKIGFVAGYGTTNAPMMYSYSDNTAADKVAYRLKQIDRDGKSEYSKVVTAVVAAPQNFGLSQNYPNPFNPATTLSFTVPSNGPATLRIFNSIGQQVATLFNSEAQAGILHQAVFNAEGFSSGVYFAQLEYAGKRDLKKLHLIQ